MAKKRAFKDRIGMKLYEIPGFNRKLLGLRKAFEEVQKTLNGKKT